MDTMADKVIEKVRKLLARADETRNDNEHERAIALRQAHALLARHGLGMADISAADCTDTLGAIVKGTFALRGRGVWESGIYGQIARLNGCKCVREPARNGQPGKVYIFGRKVRAEIIRQMAVYVIESITREARRQRYPLIAFGTGAWTGVRVQVDKILADLERGRLDGEQLSTGTALMVLDQHKQALIEADKAAHDTFPNLSRSAYRARPGNRDAYHAGRTHGERVSLNNQVGHTGHKLIGGAA